MHCVFLSFTMHSQIALRARDCSPSWGLLYTPSAGTQKKISQVLVLPGPWRTANFSTSVMTSSVLLSPCMAHCYFDSAFSLSCAPVAHWDANGLWQFPLHFLVSESAYPHYVSCPLPHCLVGQS